MPRKGFAGAAVVTTITSAIASTGTGTFTISSATGWAFTTTPFTVVVDRGLPAEEKLLCSGITGTTVTIQQRAYDNTAMAAHSSGAQVIHVFDSVEAESNNAHVFDTTRNDHTQYARLVGAAFTGGITGTTAAFTSSGSFGQLITATGGITSPSSQPGTLGVPDTRNTNDLPGAFRAQRRYDFKTSTTIGVTGGDTYQGVLFFSPYVDDSGGPSHQLAFDSTGLRHRQGTAAGGWQAWKKIAWDADVVHLAGVEVVTGTKTFNAGTVVGYGSYYFLRNSLNSYDIPVMYMDGNNLVFGNDGGSFSGPTYIKGGNGDVRLQPNAALAALVAKATTGRIGIGTADPATLLSNATTSPADDYSSSNTSAISWTTAVADTYAAAIQNDHIYGGGLLIKAGNDKDNTRRLLHVANGDNTSRFIVRGNGRVGINRLLPDTALHVVGDTKVDGILSATAIGVGTPSPGGNLSVVGSVSGSQVGIHVNNTNTAGYSVLRLGTDSVAGSQVNLHGFGSTYAGTGAFAPNAGNLSNTTGNLTLSASAGNIQFYAGGTAVANEVGRFTSSGLSLNSYLTTNTASGSTNGTVMLASFYSGTNDHLAVIGTQQSSSALALAYGVKPAAGASGYVSSTAIALSRSALEIGAGGAGFNFLAAGNSTTAIGTAIAMSTVASISNSGALAVSAATIGGQAAVTTNDARLSDSRNANMATPALGFGTAASAGGATTAIRSDATIAIFDTTAPTTQAFNDSAVVGSVAFAARRDHKHAMPQTPVTSIVAGTNVTISGATGAVTINAATQTATGTAGGVLAGSYPNPSFNATGARGSLWQSAAAHETYTDANAPADFGAYFIMGTTNAPVASGQWYTQSFGLGTNYAYGSYAMQLAIQRNGDNYHYVRFREGGPGFGAWAKLKAGYADSAGTAAALSAAHVASFNTRTGAVSLTSADVTGALTYTPVNTTDSRLSDNRFPSNNADLVHMTGTESIGGQKTFTNSGTYMVNLSLGNGGVDYTPTQSNWNMSGGSTLLLNANDFSTIGFHDSGSRVDYIRVGGGVITLGYNAGWGAAAIAIPGNLSVTGSATVGGQAVVTTNDARLTGGADAMIWMGVNA